MHQAFTLTDNNKAMLQLASFKTISAFFHEAPGGHTKGINTGSSHYKQDMMREGATQNGGKERKTGSKISLIQTI